ncbi:MAG: tripartite tricarboxylate transporter TctB family protein [Reyranellaceae bacterium]
MSVNRKDLGAGLVFVVVGTFYLVYALRTLPMGRAVEMGPGYFPIVLSSLVALVGVVVTVRSFFAGRGTAFGCIPWRALIMLSLAIAIFGAFVTELGLLPAVLATAFLSCLSTSQIGIAKALVVSLGIAVFCALVFSYGIGLPLDVFGTWFGSLAS